MSEADSDIKGISSEQESRLTTGQTLVSLFIEGCTRTFFVVCLFFIRCSWASTAARGSYRLATAEPRSQLAESTQLLCSQLSRTLIAAASATAEATDAPLSGRSRIHFGDALGTLTAETLVRASMSTSCQRWAAIFENANNRLPSTASRNHSVAPSRAAKRPSSRCMGLSEGILKSLWDPTSGCALYSGSRAMMRHASWMTSSDEAIAPASFDLIFSLPRGSWSTCEMEGCNAALGLLPIGSTRCAG